MVGLFAIYLFLNHREIILQKCHQYKHKISNLCILFGTIFKTCSGISVETHDIELGGPSNKQDEA